MIELSTHIHSPPTHKLADDLCTMVPNVNRIICPRGETAADPHLSLTASTKPGIPNQNSSKWKRFCLGGAPPPEDRRRGEWSEPTRVNARSEQRGKAISHSTETKTRSRTLRVGSIRLLDQVYRAPTRVISRRARSVIQLLNICILGTSTLPELLSSGERIKLKSPPPHHYWDWTTLHL